MTEEEQIQAGARVAAFLADDAVKSAFADLDRKYWNAMKASKTTDATLAAAANARALEDLGNALQAIVDSGKLVTAKAERAKRR